MKGEMAQISSATPMKSSNLVFSRSGHSSRNAENWNKSERRTKMKEKKL